MVRLSLALLALSGLAACGGGSRGYHPRGGYSSSPVLFAEGPISAACLRSGRNAATHARCGCVQAVANRSLSNSEQRRGAVFFGDPHRAQQVRQSSRASDESFWLDWKEFGTSAEALCSST